jgi:hypothetical protein
VKYALLVLVACGTKPPPKHDPPPPPPAVKSEPWPTPAGWKSETIPFPLDFAPSLAHRGVEELRFAPGMFDPAAPGYWSYAFVWRVEDAAALDAKQLGDELTAYFRGLLAAVDKDLAGRSDEIAVTATGSGRHFDLTARVVDAFKSKLRVDLVGWAERRACPTGALWVFVFSPKSSVLRGELEALATAARC